MKQGTGTDVLGANDPRSNAIGVIYVSPNDDRTSVLAAILTQEKLGRKQVAVVLPPNQNKAFQRPGDFDDLKAMRRKLQTQVVFIAPSGPGPAEFARQRRFLVYSSLENYANALRDEVLVESASKKGWLFGSPRAKAEGASASSNGNRGGTHTPTEPLEPATQELDTPANGHYNDEDDPHSNGSVLPFVAGAAVGGGAAIAADSALNAQADNRRTSVNSPRTPHNFADDMDDADDLGPLPAPPARRPAPEELYGPTQAISPSPEADGGSIIELRPRRSRSKATLPLTPRESEPAPVAPVVAPESDSTTQLPRPRRSTGKMGAAAIGAGALAGAAAASAVADSPTRAATNQSRASAAAGAGTVVPRPGGPGRTPPAGPPPGRGGGGNGRGPRSTAGWIILGLVILVIALLACGGVLAYAQPNSIPGHVAHSLFSQQQSPASITITPSSQVVQDNYTLTGANTTNPTSRQVAIRTITGAAQSPSTSVRATGHAQHNATAATGTLTFFNNASSPQQVNAGTTFDIGGGVKLVTDGPAYIPAGNGFSNGHLSVSAHAEPAGRAGNVGAGVLNVTPCCAGGISVSNTAAFTGGQDAVNYAFLQQSDVNNAISQAVKNSTKQDALNDLSKQLHTDEQFLGSTSCTTSLQADEPIGDQGTNVSSANVTYGMKCTSTAYDNQGAQNIVKDLLTQKATSTLGSGYALINNIQTSLTGHTATGNTFSLFFSGKGVWAYQFTDAQKLQLAKAIAGKTVAQAQNILKNTPGISNATVNVNGGNTLPANYNQISIVIQPIAGLGSGGTSPTSPSPTVTGPTVQSGTPGSNGKGGSAPPVGGGS